MWAFLGSECVFFGSLITTFFVYRNVIISGASGEPLPRDVLGINFTALLAFILVTSSLTMVLSINAATQNKPRTAGLWLLATAILGTFFLAGQTYEFTKLAQEGLTLTSGIFGQCFLTLTGFHGTHVFVGVIWLLACLPRTMQRGLQRRELHGPGDGRPVLALRGRGVGGHLHPDLPAPLEGLRTGTRRDWRNVVIHGGPPL